MSVDILEMSVNSQFRKMSTGGQDVVRRSRDPRCRSIERVWGDVVRVKKDYGEMNWEVDQVFIWVIWPSDIFSGLLEMSIDISTGLPEMSVDISIGLLEMSSTQMGQAFVQQLILIDFVTEWLGPRNFSPVNQKLSLQKFERQKTYLSGMLHRHYTHVYQTIETHYFSFYGFYDF